MIDSTGIAHDARQALAYILEVHGSRLLDEPWRIQGLLRDYCPTQKREITALVAAHKECAVADLLALQNQVSAALVIARWGRQLYEGIGLSEPLAYWAVESWALALGVLAEPTTTSPFLRDGALRETVTDTVTQTAPSRTEPDSTSPRTSRRPSAAAAADQASVSARQSTDAGAKKRTEKVLAQRREYLRQAEDLWKKGQMPKAIALLERLHERLPDDSELATRLSDWRAISAQTLQAIQQDLPELEPQRRYHAATQVLDELARINSPVGGLREKRAALDRRFQAIESELKLARRAQDGQRFQAALSHCERVLAAIADHPEAIEIRDHASAAIAGEQEQALAIEQAIEAGHWALASGLLRQLPGSLVERQPFAIYQQQVTTVMQHLLAYWQRIGAVLVGGVMWILAGWIAHLIYQDLVGRFSADSSAAVLSASKFPIQLLLAAPLLGFGATIIGGRRPWKSIPRNCMVVVAAFALTLVTAMMTGTEPRGTMLSHLMEPALGAIAAGLVIAVWLSSVATPPRFHPLSTALAAVMAASYYAGTVVLENWIHAQSNSVAERVPLLIHVVTAVSLCGLLATFGLVDRGRKFALVPLGALIAIGLSMYSKTNELGPLLMTTIVSLTYSGAALALAGPSMSWSAIAGVIVLCAVGTWGTMQVSSLETVPDVSVLLLIWWSTVMIHALRTAPPGKLCSFILGLQFLTGVKGGPTQAIHNSPRLSELPTRE